MEIRFLVTFTGDYIPPVLLNSLENAERSWQLSYHAKPGRIWFLPKTTDHWLVYHDNELVGTITRVCSYNHPTHF